MRINLNVYTKSAVTLGAVLLLLVALVVPKETQAQKISDLQKAITDLQSQIEVLLQNKKTNSQANPASKTSCDFFRDLNLGKVGEDVRCLQKFLNTSGIIVVPEGVGSPGNESTYFGLRTKRAVEIWQRLNGIPNTTGYFGSLSRDRYAELIVKTQTIEKVVQENPTSTATSTSEEKGATTSTPPQTLTLVPVSQMGKMPEVNRVVPVGIKDQTYLVFKITALFGDQRLTSLKITASSTATSTLHTTTLSNIRLYRQIGLLGVDPVPFAQTRQLSCANGVCTHTFSSAHNILPEDIKRNESVVIFVKADIADGGVAHIGDNFRFLIASDADVTTKDSISGNAATIVGVSARAEGLTYVTPARVLVTADYPLTPTTIGRSSGGIIGRFKVTNTGSAPIVMTNVNIRNSGSATSSLTYDLSASSENGNSGDSSIAYISNSTSTVFGSLSVVAESDRRISGGSSRYLTVKINGLANTNDTFSLSLNSITDLLYSVTENNLGYSVNPETDTDLDDSIGSLPVEGVPSLSMVTTRS